MRRKRLNTDSYRRKKTLRSIVRWVVFVVAVTGFIYLMNQPYFFIEDVKVLGTKSIQSDAVVEEVENHLAGSWLGIIPRKNMFFYGGDTLKQRLYKVFPEIYTMDISTHVSEIDITIDERDVHSLWCVDREYEHLFDEECYFADQDGYWYAKAPYFSDNVLTKIFLDPKVDSIMLGDRFFNGSEFERFFTFRQALEENYKIEIQKIIFRPQGDVEMKMVRIGNHVFSTPVTVWFNTEDTYERIYRNIGIVLEQDAFVDEFNEYPDNLESIDVRFDGRIFYKFRKVN